MQYPAELFTISGILTEYDETLAKIKCTQNENVNNINEDSSIQKENKSIFDFSSSEAESESNDTNSEELDFDNKKSDSSG